MSNSETFSCKFKGGPSVTVRFDIEALERGKDIKDVAEFQWSGTPSRKIIPDYVRWMHTVMSQIAKRTGKRILYAYPGGSEGMAYVYEPDGTFKKG